MSTEIHPPNPEQRKRPLEALLPIDSTGMSMVTIQSGLDELVHERDMTHVDSESARARFVLNSSLVVARVTHHFADLKDRPRADVQQTLEMTKLAELAELTLDNIEAQDKLRELTEKLTDTIMAYGDTNLIRTIKEYEKRFGRRYPKELMRAKRIALLMLTK